MSYDKRLEALCKRLRVSLAQCPQERATELSIALLMSAPEMQPGWRQKRSKGAPKGVRLNQNEQRAFKALLQVCQDTGATFDDVLKNAMKHPKFKALLLSHMDRTTYPKKFRSAFRQWLQDQPLTLALMLKHGKYIRL